LINISVNGSSGYILLETDNFKAQINPILPPNGAFIPNRFGCTTYVNTASGWLVALNSSYAFLKVAHKDFAYVGQLWPHAANQSANGGTWQNLIYGSRVVNSINEVYAKADWINLHPVSDVGNQLGVKVKLSVEWILREGQSRVYRNDTLVVDQDMYDIQINHFAGIDAQTAALQGLVKTYIDDCDSAKTWTLQAGLTGGRSQVTTDKMIGSASTKITVNAASGNTGKVVYQTLASENWSDYHHYGYWVKTRDGDTANAIRWYIIDGTGGKQYLGQPVSLTKDYVLNDAHTAHDYIGRWRQVYVDLTGITRGNVTQWGFECRTNALIDFYLDDVFRFAWQEYDQTTTLENIVYPTITYPSTFRDAVAFPNWPLLADFTKLTHLPFAVSFSSHDEQSVEAHKIGSYAPAQFYSDRVRAFDNYWDGASILWRPGSSYDGLTGTVTEQLTQGTGSVINSTVLKKYNDPHGGALIDQPVWDYDGALMSRSLGTGTLASAIMVKSKYSVQWVRIRGINESGEQFVAAGTRAVARVRDLVMHTYTFESVYCSEYAATRTAGRNSLLSFYNTWDVPEFTSRTIANLPAVNKIQKLIQSNPSDRYETDLYTRDLITRLRETKTGYVAPAATPGIVMYRYNDAWLKNTPWDTTMTDNRVDYLQLWCDMIKVDQGLPVVAESTAAVPEGYLEIPHYNTAHTATLENGDLFQIFFWIYRDVDGFYILRDRGYGDDQPSYYNPIVEDGRTYYLDYTYPLSGTSLASAYGTAAEFGQPTIRDFRLNQIQYIVDNYDIDAVALSEDCTFYHHGSYGMADLTAYNAWRVNIASLAPVTEFPRQAPGQPLSNSNLVLVDDPVLWDWKAWTIKRFIMDVTAVCHARGVLCIVDINLESTLHTIDRYNTVYDQTPSNFIQDSGGSWFTRDFSHYGRRYGVDLRDVMAAADLAYTWMYGNFNPWGFWQNFIDYTTFLNGKGFEGRVLMGVGLYPDPNPPTAQEIEDSIKLCAQYGYGFVVPASKQWGSYSTDYLWHIDRGAQQITDYSLAGSVLTCAHTRGVYFPKSAGATTLTIPGGSTVKHYSKTQTLKNTYAPYTGQSLTIAAGDSVFINTGTLPGVTTKILPYRSPYTKGLGMLSDIITELCLASGLQSTDIDTSDLALMNVFGYEFESGDAATAIKELQDIFLFDIVSKDGKIFFKQRALTSIATIYYSQMIPTSDGEAVQVTRKNDIDLPKEITVEYIDYTRGYEANTQRSTIQNTNAATVRSVKANMVLDSNYARQVAEVLHEEDWTYRDSYKFSLPIDLGRTIYPGSNITIVDDVTGDQITVRIITRTIGDYVEFDAVKSTLSVGQAAIGGTGSLNDYKITKKTTATILPFNAPLLTTSKVNTHGLFFGVDASADTKLYQSSVIQYSLDNIDWVTSQTVKFRTKNGAATTVLADYADTYTLDLQNTITVSLTLGDALTSITDAVMYNGGNVARIGDEIIQFGIATQLTSTTWRLSRLLRGRQGTEWAKSTHAIGDKFTLLDQAAIGFIDLPLTTLGQQLYFRAVTVGTLIADAPVIQFTPEGRHLLPLPVCNIYGYRQVNHDVIIRWNRRARVNAEFNSLSDVPLDFSSEKYRVTIYDGVTNNVIANIDNVTTSTYTWVSSDQQDWYGAGVWAPSPFKVKIVQVSDIVGFGQSLTAQII
jgi:hypothetical protein